MKNQYFGDIRDLFKYDLIEFILNELKPKRKSFTFIPMRTQDDPENEEGNKRTFYKAWESYRPGTDNRKLLLFLKQYEDEKFKKRNIEDIAKYFERRQVQVKIHPKREPFKREDEFRKSYFDNIEDDLLSTPLIFVDPDIGLQVEKSNEKHLLYRDVKSLYHNHHLGKDSILMIYQHFPQNRNQKEYLPTGRAESLKEDELKLKYLPPYISDNEIFFIFLVIDRKRRKELCNILIEYRNRYKEFSKLEVGNVNYK